MLSRCGELRCRHFCFRFSYLGHKWLSRNPHGADYWVHCMRCLRTTLSESWSSFYQTVFINSTVEMFLLSQWVDLPPWQSIHRENIECKCSFSLNRSVSLALGPYVKETQQSVHILYHSKATRLRGFFFKVLKTFFPRKPVLKRH